MRSTGILVIPELMPDDYDDLIAHRLSGQCPRVGTPAHARSTSIRRSGRPWRHSVRSRTALRRRVIARVARARGRFPGQDERQVVTGKAERRPPVVATYLDVHAPG